MFQYVSLREKDSLNIIQLLHLNILTIGTLRAICNECTLLQEEMRVFLVDKCLLNLYYVPAVVLK